MADKKEPENEPLDEDFSIFSECCGAPTTIVDNQLICLSCRKVCDPIQE